MPHRDLLLNEQETRRLEDLYALDVLDTPPEERFDRITRLAKSIFGTPVALVSLLDRERQWFKSNQWLAVNETPRSLNGHPLGTLCILDYVPRQFTNQQVAVLKQNCLPINNCYWTRNWPGPVKWPAPHGPSAFMTQRKKPSCTACHWMP
ncbi:MAG: hypothetical protein HLX50_19815 [Alteromonadaceae bacterium]|nr:hypothetical protein [Alteromonadaceae bacterium]